MPRFTRRSWAELLKFIVQIIQKMKMNFPREFLEEEEEKDAHHIDFYSSIYISTTNKYSDVIICVHCLFIWKGKIVVRDKGDTMHNSN